MSELETRVPGICLLLRYFTPYYTGAGKRGQRIAEGLMSRNVTVLIVTTRQYGTQSYENINGLPVYRVLTWVKRDWSNNKFIRYLDGLIETLVFSISSLITLYSLRHRYQTIYSVDQSLASFFAWLLCRLYGKRFVISSTLVGANDPLALRRKGFVGQLLYLTVAKADCFISISPAISASYRACGLPEGQLAMITHSVDTERFSPSSPYERVALRRKLGLPLDRVLVIYTGLIIPRKGVDRLIEVWGKVRHSVGSCQVHLLLVGPTRIDVPRQQAFVSGLENRIAALGLESCVTFVGEVNNVNEYLRACDVFVFLSRREGLGVSVAEAMACGLPCVTTYLKGISEFFFENGHSGFFIESQQDEKVAETLCQLVQSESLRARIGLRAREKALQLFSRDAILDKYESLFRSLARRSDL